MTYHHASTGATVTITRVPLMGWRATSTDRRFNATFGDRARLESHLQRAGYVRVRVEGRAA